MNAGTRANRQAIPPYRTGLMVTACTRSGRSARSSRQIEESAGLPILGSVPRYNTRAARAVTRRRFTIAAGIAASVPIMYGLVLALKWIQS